MLELTVYSGRKHSQGIKLVEKRQSNNIARKRTMTNIYDLDLAKDPH
jgi:hypothetical protein